MRLILLTLAFWTASVGVAQERTFPYRAIVEAEEEFARSGPSLKYYPTSKLRRGTEVTVVRHDPGGWYMIAPPEGSFSWIPAEYVDVGPGNRGRVKSNQVVVRVGSAFNEERDVFQRYLSTGDEVVVLGTETLTGERGPQAMLKIEPPPREYRWIMGKSLLPADQAPQPGAEPQAGPIASRPSTPPADDPFAEGEGLPAQTATQSGSGPKAEPASSADDPFAESPATPTRSATMSRTQATAGQEIRQTGPGLDDLKRFRDQLKSIDESFGQILQATPDRWEIDRLHQQYSELEPLAATPAMRSQLSMRLDAVERYRKIQREYREFQAISSTTRSKDRELAELQRQAEARLAALNGNGPLPSGTAPLNVRNAVTPTPLNPAATGASASPASTMTGRGPAVPAAGPINAESGAELQGIESAEPRTSGVAGASNPSAPAPTTPGAGSSTGATKPAKAGRFAGAGVVQRAEGDVAGLPPFALVSPGGKLLALLQPEPGVDLQGVIGQSCGIIGSRSRNAQLGADVIVVKAVEPVQLRTER